MSATYNALQQVIADGNNGKFNLDGFGVKETDDTGNTLLHWTVVYKRVEMAKKFIEAGGDKEAKNSEGKRALDIALQATTQDISYVDIKNYLNSLE